MVMSNTHSFDVYVAKEIGIVPAILLYNMSYWIKKNEANEKHFYEGKYWTYNSIKAFSKLFDYISTSAIRNALDKLEKLGWIETGNFNKVGYDRTKWYTITDKYAICQKQQMDLLKTTNGFADLSKPIPYINTYTNTDIKDMLDFDKFYELYPRKVGKKNAKLKFEKLVKTEETFNKILQDLEKRKGFEQWINNDGKYIPHPSTYLNGEMWNDEYKSNNNNSNRQGVRNEFGNIKPKD